MTDLPMFYEPSAPYAEIHFLGPDYLHYTLDSLAYL